MSEKKEMLLSDDERDWINCFRTISQQKRQTHIAECLGTLAALFSGVYVPRNPFGKSGFVAANSLADAFYNAYQRQIWMYAAQPAYLATHAPERLAPEWTEPVGTPKATSEAIFDSAMGVRSPTRGLPDIMVGNTPTVRADGSLNLTVYDGSLQLRSSTWPEPQSPIEPALRSPIEARIEAVLDELFGSLHENITPAQLIHVLLGTKHTWEQK